MDLNSVSIFISVAETGSLSAASRKTGLPVSTISRRIHALEKQLDVRLLERTTRKMQLTVAGEDLYDSCAAAVFTLKDAKSNLSGKRDLPSGIVRAILPPGYTRYLFFPLIKRFRLHYPDIGIQVISHASHEELISGSADIMFSTSSPKDHRLSVRILLEYGHQLMCSQAYLNQVGPVHHPEDLLQYDCVLCNEDEALEEGCWHLTNNAHTISLKPTEQVIMDSYLMVQDALLAGMGIGELPLLMAGPLCQKNMLTPLLPEWKMSERSLKVFTPSHHRLRRATRTFMSYVEDYLSCTINWRLM